MGSKRHRQPLTELQDNGRSPADTSLASSLGSISNESIHRPFTRRARKENKLAEVSYSSSAKSALTDSFSGAAAKTRKAPFTRRRQGKENDFLADVSYSSSRTGSTNSCNEASLPISPTPKLFKQNIKKGLDKMNHTVISNLPQGQRIALEASYASSSASCVGDSTDNISILTNSPLKRPFKRRKLEVDNSFNLSYACSESYGSVTEMESSITKKSTMFRKNKGSGIVDDVTYNSSTSITSECNSTITNDHDMLRDVALNTLLSQTRDSSYLGHSTLNRSKTEDNFELATSLHASDIRGVDTGEEQNRLSNACDSPSLITPDEIDKASNKRLSNVSMRRIRNASKIRGITDGDVNMSARKSHEISHESSRSENDPNATFSSTLRQREIGEISTTSQIETANSSSHDFVERRSSTNANQIEIIDRTNSSRKSHNISQESVKNKSKDAFLEDGKATLSSDRQKEIGESIIPPVHSPNETVNTPLFKKPFGNRSRKTKLNAFDDVSYASSVSCNGESLNDSGPEHCRKIFKNRSARLDEITYFSSPNDSMEQDTVPRSSTLMTNSLASDVLLTPLVPRKSSIIRNSDIEVRQSNCSLRANGEFNTQNDLSVTSAVNCDVSCTGDVSQSSEENASNAEEGLSLESTRRVTRQSKSDSQSSENISFQNKLFKKSQNNSQILPSPLYMTSQETPTIKNCTLEKTGLKKLFQKGLNKLAPNFSVTYEESLEDTRENTAEPVESSREESSESSSSEKDVSKSESEEEEDDDNSVSEKEDEVEPEEEENDKSVSEKEEEIAEEVENSIEAEITQGVDESLIKESCVENIPEESYKNTENTASYIELAGTESHLKSVDDLSEKSSSYSINNITVIPENSKKQADKNKGYIDYEAIQARVDARVAELTKKGIEKAKNKYKFEYPESPEKPKRTYPRKTVTKKKFPKPKLYKPAHWANKRLYKYLENCLRYEGLNRMLAAENVVKVMYETTQAVAHSKTYPRDAVQRLKVELASRKIIVTTLDFYSFVRNYLPRYFQDKVIPCIQPFTGQVWPPKDNYPETDPIPF